MKSLLGLMISAGLGLWLATIWVPGVSINLYSGSNFFGIPLAAAWQFFIIFGITLGLLLFFVKPILDTITLPLRIITLGLFGFLVSMFLVWVLGYLFKELHIPLFVPLFWTTFIITLLNFLISKFVLP
jgi:putative membrane protein